MRSRWLARQCSPRFVFSRLPSFLVYGPSPFFLQMPLVGQPSFWRGPTTVLPHVRSLSIVQRLDHRELTGRGLGVLVHLHSGFRIHLELKGVFGSRSFERRLPDYITMARFCSSLLADIAEGLFACIVMEGWDNAGRYWSEVPGSGFCLQDLRSIPRTMAVGRPSHEEDAGDRWRDIPCGCTVSSSATIVHY